MAVKSVVLSEPCLKTEVESKTKVGRVWFRALEELQETLTSEQLASFAKSTRAVEEDGLRPLVYTSLDGDDYKYVDFVRKFVFDQGAVPVHPIETLNYYLSTMAHYGVKREIIKDCYALMLACQELWVFTKERPTTRQTANLAEGILAECNLWLSAKPEVPVRIYTWPEVGIPKYLPGSNWALTAKEDLFRNPSGDRKE